MQSPSDLKNDARQNPGEKKSSWVNFLFTNNTPMLAALAMIIAPLIGVYQSNQEYARNIEKMRVEIQLTRAMAGEATDAAEGAVADVKANQSTLDQTAASAQANAKAIEVVTDLATEQAEGPKAPDIAKSSVAEAEAAKKAVVDRNYVLISGRCSQWVRETVELSQKSKTKFRYLFGATAKESAARFLKSPFGYAWPRDKARLGGKLQPGDILWKTKGSGGYGHGGIYIGWMKRNGVTAEYVAENSSTGIGRVQGAKGYRTLAQFNAGVPSDVVGRLPLPKGYKPA